MENKQLAMANTKVQLILATFLFCVASVAAGRVRLYSTRSSAATDGICKSLVVTQGYACQEHTVNTLKIISYHILFYFIHVGFDRTNDDMGFRWRRKMVTFSAFRGFQRHGRVGWLISLRFFYNMVSWWSVAPNQWFTIRTWRKELNV